MCVFLWMDGWMDGWKQRGNLIGRTDRDLYEFYIKIALISLHKILAAKCCEEGWPTAHFDLTFINCNRLKRIYLESDLKPDQMSL